ncbi:MAG: response regulator, partial [Polyangiales bacterium]
MRPRVLIIESDAHFARELTQCFHRAGAECQTAADGEEGLRLAHAQRPALIVLAVELPTGSGYLVCKRLKRHAELKQTPLILISSDPHADDNFAQHQKLRSRADLYLKKPLSCVEVVQAATEWLPVEVSEALELDAELEVDAAEGNAPMFDDELLQQLGDDLDAEIEAFADSAFDSLVADDDEAVSRSGVPAPKHSVPAVMPSAADVDDDLLQSMVQTAHDTEPPTTEPRRSSGTPGPLSLLPYSDALEGRGGAVSRDAWSQVTAPPPEAHASAASRSEAPGALPVVAAAPRSTSAPRDSWGQPRRSRRPSGPQSLSAAPGGAGQAGASTPPRRSSHPSAAAAALAGERQRLDERARHSEINRLRQEVDQLRAHADSQARAQGADPDALFALREQLSVKDNEIFALRDRLSEK